MKNKCNCVGKHIPKYNKVYKIDYDGGHVFLCATALDNLRALDVEYQYHGGTPPGSVLKHFSEFIRNLHDLLAP